MKSLLFSVLLLIASAVPSVGYANTDSILVNLPEYKTQQKVLESYSKQLQNQLKSRLANAEASMAKIRQQISEGTISQADAQQEAYKLQLQLQKDEQDAQRKLGIKEQELLEPLYEKIQKGIENNLFLASRPVIIFQIIKRPKIGAKTASAL